MLCLEHSLQRIGEHRILGGQLRGDDEDRWRDSQVIFTACNTVVHINIPIGLEGATSIARDAYDRLQAMCGLSGVDKRISLRYATCTVTARSF